MIQALNDREFFRTATVRAPATEVDQKAEVIRGAKVIQFGDTNDDRPVTIDMETLLQVANLGNQPNKGIKARFAHPSMSDDGLGRYIGRWQDFRIVDDAVLADLHIAESSHETPEGDLGGYVLSLAKDDPEAFGVSIVSGPDAEAMDAIKATLPDGARVPLRLSKLRAADFVDEPAATRGGLFSMNLEDPRDLAAIAAKVIDTHFGDSDPEDVLERFARMLGRHYNKQVQVTKETIDMATEPDVTQGLEPVVIDTVQLSEVPLIVATADDPHEFVEAFGDRGARWYLEGASLEECYRRRCAELEALAVDLEHRLNVALSAIGEEEPLSASVELSQDEQRAVKRLADIESAKKRGVPENIQRWSQAFAAKK